MHERSVGLSARQDKMFKRVLSLLIIVNILAGFIYNASAEFPNLLLTMKNGDDKYYSIYSVSNNQTQQLLTIDQSCSIFAGKDDLFFVAILQKGLYNHEFRTLVYQTSQCETCIDTPCYVVPCHPSEIICVVNGILFFLGNNRHTIFRMTASNEWTTVMKNDEQMDDVFISPSGRIAWTDLKGFHLHESMPYEKQTDIILTDIQNYDDSDPSYVKQPIEFSVGSVVWIGEDLYFFLDITIDETIHSVLFNYTDDGLLPYNWNKGRYIYIDKGANYYYSDMLYCSKRNSLVLISEDAEYPFQSYSPLFQEISLENGEVFYYQLEISDLTLFSFRNFAIVYDYK